MTAVVGLADDLGQLLPLIFNCGVPLALLAVGFLAGRTIERRHLRRLDRDEELLFTIPVVDTRTLPGSGAGGAVLVIGSVVIASDHLKTFASAIKKYIGGELGGFTRLMTRGRREAICRMLRDAHGRGATGIVNVRIETSNIGAVRRRKITPMVEVIAYGTALLPPGAKSGNLDIVLPCPKCGYGLTGIDDLGCPECGWNRQPQAGSTPC